MDSHDQQERPSAQVFTYPVNLGSVGHFPARLVKLHINETAAIFHVCFSCSSWIRLSGLLARLFLSSTLFLPLCGETCPPLSAELHQRHEHNRSVHTMGAESQEGVNSGLWLSFPLLFHLNKQDG